MSTIKVRNRAPAMARVEDKDRQREFEGAEDARRAARLVNKWRAGGAANRLGERQGAQSHFLDLCELLRVDKPEDPENYCFERGDKGLARQQLFADVWKRQCFAWEFKRPGGDLRKALDKLMQYAMALDNPPLLIVSDRQNIEIHTHFTGFPTLKTAFTIEELEDAAVRARLRSAFNTPEDFKPTQSNADITKELAGSFAEMADRLRSRGIPPEDAAHFLIQCLFCFFAEGIGALPNKVFSSLIAKKRTPQTLRQSISRLFEIMKDGGDFGVEAIDYFNGGLYNRVHVPELQEDDVRQLLTASRASWAALDPSILGTLFERGLDPDKRSQLAANYTDAATIEKIIDPVIRQPLLSEWSSVKVVIIKHLGNQSLAQIRAKGIPSKAKELKSRHAGIRGQAGLEARKAKDAMAKFRERLRTFRMLDPACGSGNFLYLALKALKDLEHQVNLEASGLGLLPEFPVTGPWNVLGIEQNTFAAELARVSVWIAELQWMKQHGYSWDDEPILKPLDQIQCADALIDGNGIISVWPAADVAVGNPPFIGDKKMLRELGSSYVKMLRTGFKGSVPGGSDYVCYWMDKVLSASIPRFGLVATNKIRFGRNRSLIEKALNLSYTIESAWEDEKWHDKGTAIRVSMMCFARSGLAFAKPKLNGKAVDVIQSDLSARLADSLFDPALVRPLVENQGLSFNGICLAGKFNVDGILAREWLPVPNPNGEPNSRVLFPILNGVDVTQRSRGEWVIDFGPYMSREEASLFEMPFRFVEKHVRPARIENNRAARSKNWWRHGEARPGMRLATQNLARYLVTPETPTHRFFSWMDKRCMPDHMLVVIAKDDDATFGILSSTLHEAWARRVGSPYGNHPTAKRYNHTRTFQTYPFPEGLTPDLPSSGHGRDLRAARISDAAVALVNKRDRWLNPPEWTHRIADVVPGYPERLVAHSEHEADLKKRTLTNLYNERPAWLANLHEKLDVAVAAAYGWEWPMSDDEILKRLFLLNQERSSAAS